MATSSVSYSPTCQKATSTTPISPPHPPSTIPAPIPKQVISTEPNPLTPQYSLSLIKPHWKTILVRDLLRRSVWLCLGRCLWWLCSSRTLASCCWVLLLCGQSRYRRCLLLGFLPFSLLRFVGVRVGLLFLLVGLWCWHFRLVRALFFSLICVINHQ